MMKIATLSDTHGRLPPHIDKCDLLLLSGDICPDFHSPVRSATNFIQQAKWLSLELKPWLESLPVEKVIACWGNHDFVGEHPDYVPTNLPWTLLKDDFFIYKGIKIWGSPWQLPFFDWAFNLSEQALERKYSFIQDDVDIIVSHGPPFMYGDRTRGSKEHPASNCGSISLSEVIQKVKPALVVTGHIHPAYGTYQANEKTIVVNASLVDENYRPKNDILYFDWDEDTRTVKRVDCG
jgi:Icc-related predicted phosphoesterase